MVAPQLSLLTVVAVMGNGGDTEDIRQPTAGYRTGLGSVASRFHGSGPYDVLANVYAPRIP